ncbi:restriction of telomere capping protein 5 [Naviculisporaceae sp. PSN 640]
MGQAQSSESRPPPTREELTKALANKFAEKCFTSLELYSLKDVFKSLADDQDGVRYLKQDTIAHFLGIPDILGVSSVLFQMVSYIGAFPFLQDAPAVLGLEQMVIVIAILTNRYKQVLVKGASDQRKLLFKSLAVYDRKLSATRQDEPRSSAVETEAAQRASTPPPGQGFAVDIEGDEEEDGDEGRMEDDQLVLSALDSLDYTVVPQEPRDSTGIGAMIPADNFRKLIMLLLLIAPLNEQENLSMYAERVSGSELDSLRDRAECILAAFLKVEQSPGIKLTRFNTIVPISMPYLFDGLGPLFEHFLFSKNLDLSQHRAEAPPTTVPKPPQPLLQDNASIMNLNVLSQLSLFIPGSSLFRRVRLLYSGDDDGFSMGSFESKVFNWRAPTILLVRGIRLPTESSHIGSSAESAFLSTLPPRRFPSGGSEDAEQLTFGLYLGQPWKYTNRECMGGEDTILFQLEPIHDVFLPSALNKDYVSYIKPSSSTSQAGIAIGCPPPHPTQTFRRSNVIPLGSVSLVLDSSFEYGCFTHDQSSRGGAFQPSPARRVNFQERFEVTHLEVWGCGGDEEAKLQAERWAWEAREAEARRRINLGTGDIEADRALLEMAGLIGANRSGGSMG